MKIMTIESMKTRLNTINKRIKNAALGCGRDPDEIKLVAVSKKKPASDIRLAFDAGTSIFGENYIQESMEKSEALKDLNLSWHYIGHLQSNKAKFAVKIFDLIHSVDSLKLAKEIDKQAMKTGKIQNILIQVNISMEESKSGVEEDNAENLVKEISHLENLSVRGLMTMPPYYNEPEMVKPYFKALRLLRDKIKVLDLKNVHMDELSMGMTGDFESAIEEGATLVRIGTAIFGERQ